MIRHQAHNHRSGMLPTLLNACRQVSWGVIGEMIAVRPVARYLFDSSAGFDHLRGF